MQEAVATTTEHVNTTYNYTGESAMRCGFRHGGQFVATWPCRDGYVSITTNTQKAWDPQSLLGGVWGHPVTYMYPPMANPTRSLAR